LAYLFAFAFCDKTRGPRTASRSPQAEAATKPSVGDRAAAMAAGAWWRDSEDARRSGCARGVTPGGGAAAKRGGTSSALRATRALWDWDKRKNAGRTEKSMPANWTQTHKTKKNQPTHGHAHAKMGHDTVAAGQFCAHAQPKKNIVIG
jgi:hypothetical protein